MRLFDPQSGALVWDSADPYAGPVPPASEGRQWVVDNGQPLRGQERQETPRGIEYYLGGTGLPNKLAMINQMFNPVEAIGQSMQASERLFDPNTSGWGRVEAAGNVLSGIAGVVAPAYAASRSGAPAANALAEMLTGVNVQNGRNALGNFAQSEFGGVSLPFQAGDDVAQRGDMVLDLLRAGRADEITDDMLDLGNASKNTRLNEYLMQGYDLPMDDASRMARANDLGFTYARRSQSEDTPFNDMPWAMFTDTRGDIAGTLEDLETYGPGQWVGRPSSTGREAAKDLVRAGRDSRMYHQLSGAEIARRGLPDAIVEGAGLWDDPGTARLVTDEILASGGRSIATPDGMVAFGMDGVPWAHDGSVRSALARFDPRLARLKNLSAAIAAGVMMPLSYGDEN